MCTNKKKIKHDNKKMSDAYVLFEIKNKKQKNIWR